MIRGSGKLYAFISSRIRLIPDPIFSTRSIRSIIENSRGFLGLLTRPKYRAKWEEKKKWYETNFPGYLLVTEEGSELSKMADKVIRDTFC